MAGQKTALFITLIFLLVSAVVPEVWMTPVSGTITGSQPGTGDWVVDENTTVTGEDLLLNGDLTVTNEAVLVLRDSVLRLNSTFDGEFGVTVESGATLRAYNVTFTRGLASNYTFSFDTGSNGHIQDSRLEYVGASGTDQGLAIRALNVTLNNNHLRESIYGVRLFAAATLRGNTIYNTTHGIVLRGTYGANDVAADNTFDLAGYGNGESDVRYYVSRNLRVVNQTGSGLRDARVYLNDSVGGNWLDGVLTNSNGYVNNRWLVVWEVLPDDTNRTLEPFDLTGARNGVENTTRVNASAGGDLVVEVPLWPDLVVSSTDLAWGADVEIVPSGRDNETLHRWFAQNRDENDPNGWMDLHFDESGWGEGAAPFGDTGDYNTYWATNNQEAFFRHNFTMPDNIRILEASLNIASNDHGEHYFNGQLIFSDIDQNDHGQYYWNSQTPIDPSFFRLGQTNVLASKVQVGGGGGGNRQYYDAQITLKYVFDEPTSMINLHPAVVTIVVSNSGDADVDDLQLRLYDNDLVVDTFTLNLGAGEAAEVAFGWKPDGKGNHTLKVLADDPDQYTETNETNNEASAVVYIGYYGVNVKVYGSSGLSIPFNTTADFELNVTNIGDLNDTFTFEVKGIPTDWEVDLSPGKISLMADESGIVDVSVQPKRGAAQDNYTLTVKPHSSYELDEKPLAVPSGRDNSTLYNYMITTDSGDIPGDWYETDFDDANWSIGDAPFGDRSMGGIDVGTEWDESDESWVVVRHWFDIPAELNVDSAHLEMAFNNYAEPYINGHKIFDETGGGYHGAEYWNNDGDADILLDWLNLNGSNLLAIKGRDNGGGGSNRQWLDAEVSLSLATQDQKAELEVEILPTYDFVLSATEEHDWHDVGTEQTYDVNFYNYGNEPETVDFIMEVVDSEGGWMVNLSDDNETLIPDRGGNVRLEVYGYADLWVDEYINLTVTVTPRNAPWQKDIFYLNLTALLPPDNDPPKVRVRSPEKWPDRWVREGNLTLEWYILEDTNDTSFYHVYYQTVTEWGDGIESDWVFAGRYPVSVDNDTFVMQHGLEYHFYAIGEDARGNLEKNKAPLYDIWFRVDLVPPETLLTVKELGEGVSQGVLNASELELHWNRVVTGPEDDIDYYSVEYRAKPVGGAWGDWTLAPGMEHTSFKTGDFPVADGQVYQFRSIAFDDAGWRENKTAFDAQVSIDRTPPSTSLGALPHFTTNDSVEMDIDYQNRSDVHQLFIEYTSFSEGSPTNYYVWHPVGIFQQGALLDHTAYGPLTSGKRYLFRSSGLDTTGNLEPRDDILENFTGDGSNGQSYQLAHLPTPASQPEFSSISIEVDFDNDGLTDMTLVEERTLQSPSQYQVDYTTGTITFGDGVHGYKPVFGYNIVITYDGYDSWTVVDLKPPIAPGMFESPVIDLANGSADLKWDISPSKDVVSYHLEMASARSGPYTEVDQIAAPGQGIFVTHTATGLAAGQTYFFRVYARDQAGWSSDPNQPVLKVEMKAVPGVGDDDTGGAGMGLLPLVAVLLIILLTAGGGAYIYLQRQAVGAEAEAVAASVLTMVSDEELAAIGTVSVAGDPDSPFEQTAGEPGELSCSACGTLFTPVSGVSEVTCPGCGQTGGLPPAPEPATAVAEIEAAPAAETPPEGPTAPKIEPPGEGGQHEPDPVTSDQEAEVDEAEVDEAEVDEAEVDEAEVDEAEVDEAEVDEAEAEEAKRGTT